jgi:hypothetical protein
MLTDSSPVWTNGWATLYQAAAQEIPLPDQSVHMVVTTLLVYNKVYEQERWAF